MDIASKEHNTHAFLLLLYCIFTEIPGNDKPRIRNIYTVSRIRGLYKRNVVEPRGVEPLSEDQTNKASPSAVCVLTFPPPISRRQDISFSSFIKSRRPQSLRRLVPCYYDVDGLRRRRLRVDDRLLSGESYVIVVVSYCFFPLSGGSGPPLASLPFRIPVETKYGPEKVGKN